MQKYNEAKGRNQVVQQYSANFVTDKAQKRICKCGDWLDFIADFPEEKLKLMAANFCKWRFCPMCAWRKARVDALRISVLMSYIAKEHRKSFIMVTLTAPNVKSDKLHEEITRYNKAFTHLTKRKDIAAMNSGYIRKLEITYNEERDDYHPHFHVIFAVNRGYFSGGRYMRQERWLEHWRDVMDDYTITQVDVRKVKQRDDAEGVATFDTAEFSKYVAKDEDFTHNADVFETFYNALKGRQALTYNGLFATANKMYKADELDEYKTTDNTVYYWQIFYTWKGKEYNIKERRALDATDKLFLANKGIDTELVD